MKEFFENVRQEAGISISNKNLHALNMKFAQKVFIRGRKKCPSSPNGSLICDLPITRSDASVAKAILKLYKMLEVSRELLLAELVHYIPNKVRALRHARVLLSYIMRANANLGTFIERNNSRNNKKICDYIYIRHYFEHKRKHWGLKMSSISSTQHMHNNALGAFVLRNRKH